MNEKVKFYRIKESALARLKAFAEFHQQTVADQVYKCLRAYKKRKPDLSEEHELNPFRMKTELVGLAREKVGDELLEELDGFLINQIILWWTDKNGKVPPFKESFKENAIPKKRRTKK